jgi:hypothetical protein
VRPTFGRFRDGAQQVVRVPLVELEVTGARDPEEMRAVHPRVRVQQVDVGAQHFLDWDHGERPARNLEQPLGVARQLQLGEVRLAARAAPEHHGQREPEVRQVRQWMPGAQRHRQRRELGIDLVAAACAKARLLLGGEVAPAKNPHAQRLGGAQAFGSAARLGVDDRRDLALHAIEPIAGRHPVEPARVCTVAAAGRALPKLGHAHHVDLVEIARDDAEEAEALPERRGGILRDRQHATLKGQKAHLGAEHLRDGVRLGDERGLVVRAHL